MDISEQKNGFMFINIFDSAISRSLGDVGKAICHIYAGLDVLIELPFGMYIN